MSSETTIVAAGYRIHEWKEQICACQNQVKMKKNKTRADLFLS